MTFTLFYFTLVQSHDPIIHKVLPMLWSVRSASALIRPVWFRFCRRLVPVRSPFPSSCRLCPISGFVWSLVAGFVKSSAMSSCQIHLIAGCRIHPIVDSQIRPIASSVLLPIAGSARFTVADFVACSIQLPAQSNFWLPTPSGFRYYHWPDWVPSPTGSSNLATSVLLDKSGPSPTISFVLLTHRWKMMVLNLLI